MVAPGRPDDGITEEFRITTRCASAKPAEPSTYKNSAPIAKGFDCKGDRVTDTTLTAEEIQFIGAALQNGSYPFRVSQTQVAPLLAKLAKMAQEIEAAKQTAPEEGA